MTATSSVADSAANSAASESGGLRDDVVDRVLPGPTPINSLGRQAQEVEEQCADATTTIAQLYATDGDVIVAHGLARRADQIRLHCRRVKLGASAELAATELCRRAERALLFSIQQARRRNELLSAGQGTRRPGMSNGRTLEDYGVKRTYLGNMGGNTMLGVSIARFDDVLDACRANGDLSRVAVLAEITKTVRVGNRRGRHIPTIRRMAGLGFTSLAIADRIKISDSRVRRLAREAGIPIPGDSARAAAVRVDPHRIVDYAVTMLAGFPTSLALLTPATLDRLSPQDCDTWASALSEPLGALRALHKELNIRAHRH